jgi:uncharacterized protein YdeI (YjbR/CyaY-like superfamily)
MKLESKPVFFATPEEFRKWLQKNHDRASELVVGFYKVGSGKPSMTWSESVDQAICFGWIDGLRKSIDDESYLIRFTPRKSSSIWSAINIKKVKELTKKGLMQPAGIASFKLKQEAKSKIYSYEKEVVTLSAEFEKKFKTNKKAWTIFQSFPPSYQKPAIHWVMTAKQEMTRNKRLEELIKESASGMRVKHLRPFKK